jgi:FkbM family methyltransferase|tara:strand:- start:3400 stop:4071 length:672 start_codon:yes stop_codon:yes gene_type:complete
MITAQHFNKVLNSNDPAVDPYDLISDAVNEHVTECDSEILSKHFAGRTGSFLCVGAGTAYGKDQTIQLLENGWTGVYCEPDPRAFMKLTDTVKPHKDRVTLINAAVSPRTGLAPFNLATHTMHSSLIDSWAERHGDSNIDRIQVNCVTLKQLLTQKFDYIQTDTEGLDVAIISSVDWAKVPSCEMICTEAGAAVLKQLCQQGDYIITDITPTNAFYQHRSKII